MELHHRLRRDPSWHPSGCNICGQLGHQAANCTTGTVNWRQMYGENAFSMRPAIFQSDLDAAKKSKQIDFEDLEKRARDYAKMREEGGPGQQAPPQGRQQHAQQAPQQAQQQPAQQPVQQQQQQPQAASVAPQKNGDAVNEEAQRRKAAEDGLPEGWSVAFDASKKPYYWHKVTKKTMWEKPTAATPIQ